MQTKKEVIEGVTFVIHFHTEEDKQLLLEAKTKGVPLDGTYSAIKHKPHNPTGEYHLHVYDKGNEIFSINKSGSPHDGYHGVTIPKRAFDALKSKYPEWNWPSNRILESYTNVSFFETQVDSRSHLRPVKVASFKIDFTPNNWTEEYAGFFHGFADVPFETGGGWVSKTKAIVEGIDGQLNLVPIEKITFLDISE